MNFQRMLSKKMSCHVPRNDDEQHVFEIGPRTIIVYSMQISDSDMNSKIMFHSHQQIFFDGTFL